LRSEAENTRVGDDVIVLDGSFGDDIIVVDCFSEEDVIVVDGIFGEGAIVVDGISGEVAFVVVGISGEDASVMDGASEVDIIARDFDSPTFFTSTSAASICWVLVETSLSSSKPSVTTSVSSDALFSTSARFFVNSSPSKEMVDGKEVTNSKSKGGAGRDRPVLGLHRQLATNTSFRH